MNWEIAVWLIVFTVCLLVEIITLGLTTIWACGGALISMFVAIFGGSVPVQIVVFVIITTILFFTTRPIARRHMDNHLIRTNVDELVGRHVIVTGAIDNLKPTGQVMINGVEWTARSENGEAIDEGAEVEIAAISGVKAIVRRV